MAGRGQAVYNEAIIFILVIYSQLKSLVNVQHEHFESSENRGVSNGVAQSVKFD